MNYLLFLPGVIFLLCPLVAAIVKERREIKRHRAIIEARRARKEAADAEKAKREAEKASAPPPKRGRPPKAKEPTAEKRAPVDAPAPVAEKPADKPAPVTPIRPETVSEAPPTPRKTSAFTGHTVSFTGKLDSMTRAEAIKAVQDAGGKGYATMPVSTTLLVVGDKPGMCKMDKADLWIGQVRKITEAQFLAMLKPTHEFISLTLEEFAQRYCKASA